MQYVIQEKRDHQRLQHLQRSMYLSPTSDKGKAHTKLAER
jgi:hypothetical protein